MRIKVTMTIECDDDTSVARMAYARDQVEKAWRECGFQTRGIALSDGAELPTLVPPVDCTCGAARPELVAGADPHLSGCAATVRP